MPAEWHPHDATWLTWPKNEITWPGVLLDGAEEAYLQAIAALVPGERVNLLVDDETAQSRVEQLMKDRHIPLSRVSFYLIPTVDSWIRDYGPNFLLRETGDSLELAFNHWGFNAWGNKYEDLKEDSRIPALLEYLLGVRRFTPPMVLEGGSIDVNGEGLCLTTEQCLLHPNRNPDLSRSEIESALHAYLGTPEIVWLGDGIAGDDTDGHIDDIARFVGPRTVVCAVEKDPDSINFRPLQDNLRRLELYRTKDGQPLRVVQLVMPEPAFADGEQLPASYANFYIANKVVLVPTFGQERDREAIETLQPFFPSRRVIGIDCRALVHGMGTLHCLTQQQPSVNKS